MHIESDVFGIVNKFNKDGNKERGTFEPKKVRVMFTDDRVGKTLSLGSEEDGFMITVPYEAIEKMIKKGGK